MFKIDNKDTKTGISIVEVEEVNVCSVQAQQNITRNLSGKGKHMFKI